MIFFVTGSNGAKEMLAILKSHIVGLFDKIIGENKV